MEIVRELLPGKARIAVYAVYAVVGIVVGSVAAATGGDVAWVEPAERVLAYLAVPMAVLAGLNVPDSDEPTDYEPRYAKD